MKDKLAEKLLGVVKTFPDSKKKEMVAKFRKKHKDRPDVDGLVHDFCKRIEYNENKETK